MIPRSRFLRRIIKTFRRAADIPPAEARSEAQLSRREFLRTASLTGVGALAGCAGLRRGGEPWQAKEGAVAIVGGGVAGLTAAYRLQRQGVEVHLYEAAQRLGGRMWTKRDFNDEGMFCELGGEFVDTGHKEIRKLAAELGIGIQPLVETGGGEYDYIDGRIYSDEQLIPAFRPLAKRIAADAEGLYDDEEEYTDKARAFDRMRLSDYLREAGRATGTAEWVVKMLDVAYVTEYGVATELQSTMNFIDLISTDTSDGFAIYGDSDEAFRVAGGSGALPDALERRITGKVQMHRGHRLKEISDDGKRVSLTFDEGKGAKTAAFSRVILAIPFSVLRHVSGVRRLALSPAKQKAIQELGAGENAKAMFGFSSKFWRSLKPACNGGAFSDALFEAWDTSNNQRGQSGILTCYIGGRAARRFSHGSSGQYLDELEKCFPGAKAAHDGNKASMDWTHFAFAKGSFSATLVGQYCGMIADGATPELNGRLLFSGEHTSEEGYGYMNGGIESGQRAASELLVPA